MPALTEVRTPPAPAAEPWHALPVDAALARLGSAVEGLSAAEVARRRAEFGLNVLERARGDGPWQLLFRQIHNPLIYVLLVSAALAMAMGKGLDGVVVLGVVVLNTIIGFLQEYRAGRAIEALIEMVPDTATVVRGGVRATVPAAELVPGDIVLLQSGDKVPADLRLLTVRGLQVEEAALTGESAPVSKGTDPVAVGAVVGDRTNMAFSGTLVTYGTASAVVVATGSATELGRVSAMLREATHLETPLMRQMAAVGKWLTVSIVVVAVLLLIVGLARGFHWIEAKLAAITLAVAAIPEGLPAIITIALAIGVRRMAARRAIVRRLPAVETLGSTTVICTDKTGTLTRNEMTVQALWTPEGEYRLSGVGYRPAGELLRGDVVQTPVPPAVLTLVRDAALCSDAELRAADGAWTVVGDPTEGALIVAAEKLGLRMADLRRSHARIDAIPFESEQQFMATLSATPEGPQRIVLKGAPEVVLKRCDRCSGGGPLDAAAVLREVERLAGRGLRVLAVAARAPAAPQTTLDHADVQAGFELEGLLGMIDPPRPEAIAAVRACHAAGITVKMITGDHKGTAEAIGRELGLVADGGVLTGRELAALDDAELSAAAGRTNVFARVAPEHKLRLVRTLQARGEIVAMTGDGVNDAPALKQADIGVAMGITGTAVSKESADIVLTDDNFASIAAAVEEGRRVYDNLVKSLAFVLPTNLGEALIILIAVMFFPVVTDAGASDALMPMRPVQILWINLVATVALALPLAFEAREPDVMRRPPRRPNAPILGRFVLVRTAVVAVLMAAGAIGLFLYEYAIERPRVGHAVAVREAQTMAVTTVVLFQIFYLLNCRSLRDSLLRIGLFTNPYIYLGIAVLLLLQLAFVYLPLFNRVFGSAPLNAEAWGKSTLVAAVVLPVIAAEKAWRQRRRDRAPAARGAAGGTG